MSRRDHWSEDAACSGAEYPEDFYSDTPEVQRETIRDFCNGCTVRDLCLNEAIAQEGTTVKRQYGIRGGMTGTDRRRYAIALAKETA